MQLCPWKGFVLCTQVNFRQILFSETQQARKEPGPLDPAPTDDARTLLWLVAAGDKLVLGLLAVLTGLHIFFEIGLPYLYVVL